MFPGFSDTDFDSFAVEGLEGRMQAIRERIQPKFHALWQEIGGEWQVKAGMELFLHVAKHARRTVNPPHDTWMAVGHNKRGYKAYPHFQVGLFDDRLFIWLALIYEVDDKAGIARRLLERSGELLSILDAHGFVLSPDHMRKDAAPVDAGGLRTALERFRDRKNAELLLGWQIPRDEPVVRDGAALLARVNAAFDALLPVYRLTLQGD